MPRDRIIGTAYSAEGELSAKVNRYARRLEIPPDPGKISPEKLTIHVKDLVCAVCSV